VSDREPNKFAPPKDWGAVPSAAKARVPGSRVLAGFIFLHSIVALVEARLLIEMVRTGEANAASGLGVILAWALLLAGGVRLLIGRRRPRYIFATSAVLGLLSLSGLLLYFVVSGAVIAAISFAASFVQSKPSAPNDAPEV
jgi:hypothetical protein